jgi:hypothetical protein
MLDGILLETYLSPHVVGSANVLCWHIRKPACISLSYGLRPPLCYPHQPCDTYLLLLDKLTLFLAVDGDALVHVRLRHQPQHTVVLVEAEGHLVELFLDDFEEECLKLPLTQAKDLPVCRRDPHGDSRSVNDLPELLIGDWVVI